MSDNEQKPYLVQELLVKLQPLLLLDKFCDPDGQNALRDAKRILKDRATEKLIRKIPICITNPASLLTEHARIEKFKLRYLTKDTRRFEFYHGYEGEMEAQIWETFPATQEQLDAAQHIIDTIPDRSLAAMRKQRAKEGKTDTIQWRRPISFQPEYNK